MKSTPRHADHALRIERRVALVQDDVDQFLQPRSCAGAVTYCRRASGTWVRGAEFFLFLSPPSLRLPAAFPSPPPFPNSHSREPPRFSAPQAFRPSNSPPIPLLTPIILTHPPISPPHPPPNSSQYSPFLPSLSPTFPLSSHLFPSHPPFSKSPNFSYTLRRSLFSDQILQYIIVTTSTPLHPQSTIKQHPSLFPAPPSPNIPSFPPHSFISSPPRFSFFTAGYHSPSISSFHAHTPPFTSTSVPLSPPSISSFILIASRSSPLGTSSLFPPPPPLLSFPITPLRSFFMPSSLRRPQTAGSRRKISSSSASPRPAVRHARRRCASHRACASRCGSGGRAGPRRGAGTRSSRCRSRGHR